MLRPDETDGEDPTWQGQLTSLAEQVRRWTGNRCEVLELSEAELARAVADGDRLSRDLLRDAVGVVGRAPRQVLRVATRSPTRLLEAADATVR